MRAFEEIREDVEAALLVNDAAALAGYADELEGLDTPEAMALGCSARGRAYYIRSDNAEALRLYEQALVYYEEQHDLRAAARVVVNIASARTRMGDHAEALESFGHAERLYEQLGDRKGEAIVMSNRAVLLSDMGKYAEALEQYQRARAVFEESDHRAGLAFVSNSIGGILIRSSRYPEALEQLHDALAKYEELGDRSSVASTLGSMGVVYRSTGHFAAAIEHFHRALALHTELNEPYSVAKDLSSIGSVYLNTEDHERSLTFNRQALQMYEELGDQAGIALVTGNMGLVYASALDFTSALDHLKRALAIHEERDENAAIASVMGNMIRVLLQTNADDEATEMLDRQERLKIDAQEVLASHWANRAVVMERRGDLESAEQYLQQALAIADAIGSRAKSAEYHKHLRDLAQRRNDFAAYIGHNNEYTRINAEILGKETSQRMAMMEAERKVEGERREREKERALLYSALPKSVADRMIRGEKVSGDHYDDASVIFADIVGFTQISEQMAPGEVVQLLEELFSKFDAICEQHNVTKIKTIGDSYMAVAFPSDESTEHHTIRAARCALAMSHSVSHKVAFRIGMHYGPATAGVIGTQRLQYDVWGDTVNVASRMESAGEPGKVHVSEAFALNLKSNTEYTIQNPITESRNQESHEVQLVTRHLSLVTQLRGSIDIKGKGPMNTYWLEEK